MHHTEAAPSPLAKALAAQSQAQFGDLEHARGIDASTFSALATRAEELIETLRAKGCADATTAPIRAHKSVLDAVTALLADPKAGAIPPSNDRIYGAVLDITELGPIVRILGGSAKGLAAIERHLTLPGSEGFTPASARADRLALSFASICKKGGLGVTLGDTPGAPFGIEIEGWRAVCVPAVALRDADLDDAITRAAAALRDSRRPGVFILEASPLLAHKPLTVAEDRVAINAMNERLESFMLSVRERVIETAARTISTDQAFGLVVHATMAATNAASRRLLFAECFRAVNLCDAEGPQAEGFRGIAQAMQRAG